MDMMHKIKASEAYAGLTEAEVARRIGSSAQSFHQRMRSCKFSPDEYEKIAEAIGAKWVCYFEFPDGKKI